MYLYSKMYHRKHTSNNRPRYARCISNYSIANIAPQGVFSTSANTYCGVLTSHHLLCDDISDR